MTGNHPASPRCSVVIRAYNEQEHIGRLLTGITRQTLRVPDEVEIILVDSGSTDATIAIASTYPVRVVHIQPDEFTFGRSLNLGISHARGEYLVMASAHVYPVYPDWLERLLAPFEDPQIALSYGKQRGEADTKYSEQRIFAQWFPDHSTPSQDYPFCNNANAAIRRSLWEQHPYDENLTGLEDLEWARWALEQGLAISYVSEAEVIHVHNETPRDVYNRYRREAMAFKRIYPHEQFSLLDFLRLVTSNIANDLHQASQDRILWSQVRSVFWFRWMQFWGTYQGYRHSGPVTRQLRRTFYYPHRSETTSSFPTRSVKPIQYHE